MPDNSDRNIICILEDLNVEYYTYQLKHDKNFRVVIRNIHYDVDKVELEADIEEHGFKVCSKYSNEKIPLHAVCKFGEYTKCQEYL